MDAVFQEADIFEKILVPLDGSTLAAKVLPTVVELAKKFNSQVTLIHACHTEGFGVGEATPGVGVAHIPGLGFDHSYRLFVNIQIIFLLSVSLAPRHPWADLKTAPGKWDPQGPTSPAPILPKRAPRGASPQPRQVQTFRASSRISVNSSMA
jgi:hypothetical protein